MHLFLFVTEIPVASPTATYTNYEEPTGEGHTTTRYSTCTLIFLSMRCSSVISEFLHMRVFPSTPQSVRFDWHWCKLQIFYQCSLWPRYPYSQPAQPPPLGFSPNLITCFICTSLYFNQDWARPDSIVRVPCRGSPCQAADTGRRVTELQSCRFDAVYRFCLWITEMELVQEQTGCKRCYLRV